MASLNYDQYRIEAGFTSHVVDNLTLCPRVVCSGGASELASLV